MEPASTPDQIGYAGREELARRHVDAAENWIRLLIHHQLSTAIGQSYIEDGPWKDSLKRKVRERKRLRDRPLQREVDATSFEQAVTILCRHDYLHDYFRDALQDAYPDGVHEARTFLNRIIAIRNDVYHGHGCTARQLERAICYSNELIDSIKEFFREKNMDNEYNVPMISRFSDNKGNSSTMENVHKNMNNRIIDNRNGGNGDLYLGDNLVIDIDIDASFPEYEYVVSWYIFGDSERGRQQGRHASIPIELKHVGEQLEISFEIKTNREWHRQNGLDDRLSILYRVLPPPR